MLYSFYRHAETYGMRILQVLHQLEIAAGKVIRIESPHLIEITIYVLKFCINSNIRFVQPDPLSTDI